MNCRSFQRRVAATIWVAVGVVLITAAAQGTPFSVHQLVQLVQDPSTPPAQAVATVLATGRLTRVNSSRALWEALRSEAHAGGALIVELQRDLALDDPVWEQPVTIGSGRSVVLRSQLNTSTLDVSSGVDAVARAGAATLSLSRRVAAIIVRGGAILAFDGLQIVDMPALGSWLATKPSYPYGLDINPAIICEPGCMKLQRQTYMQWWSKCENMDGIVYRAGLLVGNTSAVVKLNDTAYALLTGSRSVFHLLDAQTGQSPGDALLVAQDGIWNCLPDTSLSTAEDPAADQGSSAGLAAWVWALIALAIAALLGAAVAVLLYRRRGRSRRSVGELVPAGIKVVSTPSGDLKLAQQDSPSKHDADIEKADGEPLDGQLPPAQLQHLRSAWHSSIGRVQRVQLLEPIGRGGFSTVWKARWRGTLVAAKLIEHDLSADILARIQREASLSTSVSHPNMIVTYRVATVSLEDLSQLQPQLEVGTASPTAGASSPDGSSSTGVQPAISDRTAAPAAALEPDGPAAPAAPADPAVPAEPAERAPVQEVRHSPSMRLLRQLTRSMRLLGSASRKDATGARPASGSSTASSVPLRTLARQSPHGPDVWQDVEGPPVMGATIILQELCQCSVEDCIAGGQFLYAQNGSPDQVAVLRMLLDAALGLDYLAAAGIVHGDVKPANVLIASTGCNRRGWQAKVADLGLSRMLPPDASSMAATSEVGTLAFTAPEAFIGRLTKAADVYSFGIMMLEVWTRRRAWQGMMPAQLVYAVTAQHVRPQVPSDCPPGYAALMQHCWAHAPEERPTFQQVVKALHAMLKQLPHPGLHTPELQTQPTSSEAAAAQA